MKNFILVIFFSSIGLISYAQPANDLCSGAQTITPDGTCINGTNLNANDNVTAASNGAAELGCATANQDDRHFEVWYMFQATGNTLDVTGTQITQGNDIEIVLLQSSSPNGNGCNFSPTTTVFDSYCGANAASGTTNGLVVGDYYFILVSANNRGEGTFQLCVDSYDLAANDECDGSIASPTDSSCIAGTNVNSSPSFGSAVGCLPNGSNDVWYSFVATGTEFSFGLTGASGAIGVVLFDDATCASGLFGVLNSWCGTNTVTGTYNGLTAGNTYHYMVSSTAANETTFNICTQTADPPGISNNTDCATAIPLCSSTTQSGNSNGSGVQELNAGNQGCISFGGERESSWYTFTIAAGGTFEMTISPANGTDDYDFALWGPNPACTPTTAPIRCDFSGGGGDTGISTPNGGTVASNGAGGNNWVTTLNVTTTQQYTLLINNFSASTSPFDLSFGGTASLDCTVLPVEIVTFTGVRVENGNRLYWNTLSEYNNDYFTIMHSTDGENWRETGTVAGSGTTFQGHSYSFHHEIERNEIDYYRLAQTDYDGQVKNIKEITVTSKNVNSTITINLIGQQVDRNYRGMVIDVFSDGTTKKRIQ